MFCTVLKQPHQFLMFAPLEFYTLIMVICSNLVYEIVRGHLEEKPSGQRGKEPAKGVIPFGKMPKEGKSKMGRKDKRRECFLGTVLRGIWNEWNRIFQLIGMAAAPWGKEVMRSSSSTEIINCLRPSLDEREKNSVLLFLQSCPIFPPLVLHLFYYTDVATLTLVVAIDITCLKKKYALVINHLYGSTLSYNVVIIDTPSVPN
ncbi:hypothetical protein LguiB_015302 [Lonicera macranthoides]